MSISTPPSDGPFFSLADLGLSTSQVELLQSFVTAMQGAFPAWQPSPANLEYLVAVVFSSWASDCAQMCVSGANELFAQFGTQLLQLPSEAGSAAQATATITAVDTSGYTLLAGSQVALSLGGAQLAFLTAQPLVIPQGQTSGQVTLVAVNPGTAFNGAGNPAQMLSIAPWVSSVSVVASAAEGIDPEDPGAYLQRLAATLQLLTPRPITANDYAQLSINFQPAPGTAQQEIGRASAIDGYNPANNTYSNERMVCVCVTDANGVAVNQQTMTALAAWLETMREVNFIVNVVAPNYSTVYAAVSVVGQPGFPASVVASNVQQALLNYLNPVSFGTPEGALVGWSNYQYVYLSKVEAVIQQAAGVDHVVTGSLAVDLNPTPTNTVNDLSLPGPFPLPMSSSTSIPLSAIQVTTQ